MSGTNTSLLAYIILTVMYIVLLQHYDKKYYLKHPYWAYVGLVVGYGMLAAEGLYLRNLHS